MTSRDARHPFSLRGRARRPLVPLLVSLGLVAGFVRELVLAYVFGASREVEIFRVAYALPSVLSETVAVSFVAAFIVILMQESRAEAVRRAVWATALLGGLICLVGTISMPWQADVLAPGFSPASRDDLVLAGRLCWLMSLGLLLSYPLRALMNVDGRLAASTMSLLLRNAFFLAALLLLGRIFSFTSLTAAWAAVASGLAILITYVTLNRRDSRVVVAAAPPAPKLVLPILTTLGVILIAQLILTSGRLVDRLVASTLEPGFLASVEYSYALVMALAAVIGSSANLILGPVVGRSLRDRGAIERREWRLVGGVSAVAGVAGCLLALLSLPVTRIVYQRGSFGPEATTRVAQVLAVQALALGFLVASLLLVQLLILLRARRWLLLAATAKLLVKAGVLWLAWGWFEPLTAIAVSFALAEVAGTALFGGALWLMVVSGRGRQQDKPVPPEAASP